MAFQESTCGGWQSNPNDGGPVSLPRRRISIAFIVATAFGLVLMRASETQVAFAASAERSNLGTFVDEGCSHECRSCGDNKHDIVVAVVNHHSSSHLENCNTGSCSSHECGNTLRVQEVWDLALKADGRELIHLLESNPEVASYNSERQALQFRCDKGALVASLPLSQSQVQALSALD